MRCCLLRVTGNDAQRKVEKLTGVFSGLEHPFLSRPPVSTPHGRPPFYVAEHILSNMPPNASQSPLSGPVHKCIK